MKKVLISLILLLTLFITQLDAKSSLSKHRMNKHHVKSSLSKHRMKKHRMNRHLIHKSDTDAFKNAKDHWYRGKRKHTSKKKKYQKKQQKKKNNDLFATLAVGFGGASAYDFYASENNNTIWMSSLDLVLDDHIAENSYYQKIKDFEAEDFTGLQEKLKHSKYLIYWLPDNWSESWFDIAQIQFAMDKGYIPVFMYWYFGDTLIDGLPTNDILSSYQKSNQRVSDFLSQLHGKKMIIMEPEFNKVSITSHEKNANTLADIIANAIDTIKINNDELLVSLCMTDAGNRSQNNTASSCGYDNCALGDKSSWDKASAIYEKLIDKLDFVSFQEMLAQFSRDPSNLGTWATPIPKAYSKSDLGVTLLAQRIANFSEYLHTKYNKPVFLPYMAIATAVWDDKNENHTIESDEIDGDGWNDVASNIYQDLYDLKDTLHSKGLFGYAPMALFDHPGHDNNGYQYFMNNEYHLGITKTVAQDDTDIHLLGDILPKSHIINFIY